MFSCLLCVSLCLFMISWIQSSFLQWTHEWMMERMEANHRRTQRGRFSHRFALWQKCCRLSQNNPCCFAFFRRVMAGVHSFVCWGVQTLPLLSKPYEKHVVSHISGHWWAETGLWWRNFAPSWIQKCMPECADTMNIHKRVRTDKHSTRSATPFWQCNQRESIHWVLLWFVCVHSITHSSIHFKKVKTHESILRMVNLLSRSRYCARWGVSRVGPLRWRLHRECPQKKKKIYIYMLPYMPTSARVPTFLWFGSKNIPKFTISNQSNTLSLNSLTQGQGRYRTSTLGPN